MQHQMPDFDALQKQLVLAFLSVDRLAVKEILTQPYPVHNSIQLVEKLVVPALEAIGSGWESGQYSLSQVYMSGRVCEELVDFILPPSDKSRTTQPKMAIAILEDYHVLGKRIVYSVLRASGFELENYGRMGVEELVHRVRQDQVKILLISVLMLPSALRVRQLRQRLDDENIAVKIAVGGAPFRFDPQLWREVGADAMGSTATEAVEIVNRIIREIS
jgi:methanogenic corrinoid protein MtbC1